MELIALPIIDGCRLEGGRFSVFLRLVDLLCRLITPVVPDDDESHQRDAAYDNDTAHQKQQTAQAGRMDATAALGLRWDVLRHMLGNRCWPALWGSALWHDGMRHSLRP